MYKQNGIKKMNEIDTAMFDNEQQKKKEQR